ncbi:MAG: response regulator transcription factor [Bacteroidales bacterium]|nr:response regulator transcription factor [Bacteroidales bacterium]
MTETKNIQIVIADAQWLTGIALQHVLNEKYSVIAWVCTKHELDQVLRKSKVSLLIIDPFQFDLNNQVDLVALKNEYFQLNILVITNAVSKTDLNGLNNAGIKNILLKNSEEEDFFTAIEATLKNKKYFSQEILELLMEQNSKKDKTIENNNLTITEIEIVRLIAQGYTTKEIASVKYISFHTVMTHRKNIFRKLKVNSVSELIMHAIKAGWIDNIEYYI